MSNTNLSQSFVLFELAGNTCGVRSQSVQSVEMVEHVTIVPNTEPFVEGLTFTRGEVIPSINLRTRFGFPKVAADPRARMLVVRPKGRTAGLLVDSVREFVSIPTNAIQPSSKVERAENRGLIDRFLEGTAVFGNRLILILNLDEILEGA